MPNTRFRLLLILSVLLTAACQTEVREAYINQDKYIDTYVSNNFADNPVYQRIVEAYQCDEVIDVYNSQFAGLFTPTWKLG